jgi:hypothetical protein
MGKVLGMLDFDVIADLIRNPSVINRSRRFAVDAGSSPA